MRIAIAESSGTPETGLAAHLALALASRGRRVLLAKVTNDDAFECGVPVAEQGTVLDRSGLLIVRNATSGNVRVLGGLGRWLAQAGDAKSETDGVTKLFSECDWVLLDASDTDDLLFRQSIALADEVLVPVGRDESCYDRLPSVLRSLAEVKSASSNVKFSGFVRCASPGDQPSDVLTATESCITREFPNSFLTTIVPTQTRDTADGSASPKAYLDLAAEIEGRAKGEHETGAPAQRRWWQLWRRN